MSPSEPPTRISDASVNRYAFETHCCAGSPPPRSLSIAGRATLTIVPSIVATPEPRIAATSVRRWRRVISAPRGSRLGSRPNVECDIVDVAPDPVLARLGRARDRVRVVPRVPARVPIRGRVAAADLPAARAHPQVPPAAADREALLATLDRVGEGREADLVEMGAVGHGSPSVVASGGRLAENRTPDTRGGRLSQRRGNGHPRRPSHPGDHEASCGVRAP